MSVTIAGIYLDPAGIAVPAARIIIAAKRTTADTFRELIVSQVTGDSGEYSFDLVPGYYRVTVLYPDQDRTTVIGDMELEANSPPGSLNDYVRFADPVLADPTVYAEMKRWYGVTSSNSSEAVTAAAVAVEAKSAAQEANASASEAAVVSGENKEQTVISAATAEDASVSAKSDAARAKDYADTAQNIADANTYYVTPEDPDGTIAGLAGTPNGKSFRVGQGAGGGFKYYLNNNGVAEEISYLPGSSDLDNVILNLDNVSVSLTNSLLYNSEEINNISSIGGNAISSAYPNVISIVNVSTGEWNANISQASSLSINRASGKNPALVSSLNVSVDGVSLFDLMLLPNDVINDWLLTSSFMMTELYGSLPSVVLFESGRVRVVYNVQLNDQINNTSTYNVYDKYGLFNATSQNNIGSASSLAVSSHSQGGIQISIPNTIITGSGYQLTNESVRKYIASEFSHLRFWYKTNTVSTTKINSSALLPAGEVSIVANNIDMDSALYGPAVYQDLDISYLDNAFDESVTDNLSSAYSALYEKNQITEIDSIYANSKLLVSIDEIYTNSPSSNMINLIGIGENRRYIPSFTKYSNGIFSSRYKPYTFKDLTFANVLESSPSLIRVLYLIDNYDGVASGINALYSQDVTGVFAPITPATAGTATSKSIAQHASLSNGVQLIIIPTELSDSGYDSNSQISIQQYIRSIARECLFVAYYGKDVSDYNINTKVFNFVIDNGEHSVTCNNVNGELSLYCRKQEKKLLRGGYIRKIADVYNDANVSFNNVPIELIVDFPAGEVPVEECIVISDDSGNVYPCQFSGEFYVNPRIPANVGFHADGSIASGSVVFNDSINSGETKHFEIKAHRVPNVVVKNAPKLVTSNLGYRIKVGIFTYVFSSENNLQLSSVVKDDNSIINITHASYLMCVNDNSFPEYLMSHKPKISLVSSGPVYSEIETIVYNSEHNGLPAGSLKTVIRYRIFNSGQVSIRSISNAQNEIPVSLLSGVYSRLRFNTENSQKSDNHSVSIYGADATITTVIANGDTHRDGTSYGPTRPIVNIVALSANSGTHLAGWRYTSTSDYSLHNWVVDDGWAWTHEYFIDLQPDTVDITDVVSKAHNRPIGFAGNGEYKASTRKRIMKASADFALASYEFWNSDEAAGINPGGWKSVNTDIVKWKIDGIGNLNDIYDSYTNDFSPGTLGSRYLTGGLLLQFASRLHIPPLQWLYYAVTEAGDAAKVTQMHGWIKSFSDAIALKFEELGGVPLNGSSSTDNSNSNSNATAMRVLALGIRAGLDNDGRYLAAFNGIEQVLTNSATYQKVPGVVLDSKNDILASAHWLAYQTYVANNYILACSMINRTPEFDMVNYFIRASSGMGGFNEVDYCISESRRGGTNTIAFAITPLVYVNKSSSLHLAESLLSVFKKEMGPRDGDPDRLFGFDGSRAGQDVRYEISFTATCLCDAWLNDHYARA